MKGREGEAGRQEGGKEGETDSQRARDRGPAGLRVARLVYMDMRYRRITRV